MANSFQTFDPVRSDDFSYDYPEGLDLKPGSELHDRIVAEVLERATISMGVVREKQTLWDDIDDTMTLHVDLSKEEIERKKRDKKKLVSLVVPFSYATREVLLTYLFKSLLNDPIFKYSPVAPEDMRKAMILEQHINLQAHRSKMGLSLLSHYSDILTYGIGVISPVWERKLGTKKSSVAREAVDEFGNSFTINDTVNEEVTLFEGHKLRNIDVRKYLPDPHVDINHIQDGEFLGYCETIPYTSLLEQERSNPEDVFNVQYLKNLSHGFSRVATGEIGYVSSESTTKSRPMDTIYMYINLIPEEWGLGNSAYPEKWFFAVTADSFVIMAKPLGLEHNMFPIVAASADPTGHEVIPMGKMELIKGMQEFSSFLLNIQAANMQKGVNDRLIIDPSLINYYDVIDNKPGGVIRTRRSAWGRGVEGAVKQLGITDITANNLQTAAAVYEMMQRSSGAVDAVQGVLQHRNDRVSASESQGVMSSALSRLEFISYIVAMQGHYDLSFLLASQTKQLATKGGMLKTLGRWEDVWREEEDATNGIHFTVDDLDVEYDVQMDETGGINGERMEEMMQLFGIAAQDPEIRQKYDVTKLFAHIARMGGIKNMVNFKRAPGQAAPMVPPGSQTETTVVPDEQFQQMQQAGNIAPMGQ